MFKKEKLTKVKINFIRWCGYNKNLLRMQKMTYERVANFAKWKPRKICQTVFLLIERVSKLVMLNWFNDIQLQDDKQQRNGIVFTQNKRDSTWFIFKLSLHSSLSFIHRVPNILSLSFSPSTQTEGHHWTTKPVCLSPFYWVLLQLNVLIPFQEIFFLVIDSCINNHVCLCWWHMKIYIHLKRNFTQISISLLD